MAISRLCSIPDCGKIAITRDYCQPHYDRYLRPADPLGHRVPRGTALRFFHEVVLPYEGDECLTWPFSTNGGYGQLRYEDRPQLVSRLVCEAEYGPPPEPSSHAAHSCGKGDLGCVAKRHLSWKSPSENEADKFDHGTYYRRRGGAKLTESDVRQILAMGGTMIHSKIAERFGVNRRAVDKILRRETWTNISI